MNKKLLLIMPKFFDYPQLIKEELSSLGYDVDFFDDRPGTSGIVKAIIRVKKELINSYIKKYFESIMETVRTKKYDVVFLISGQSLSFSEKMMSDLKNVQPDARFILYQWDSLDNFPYILNMHKFFDKCYSFDRKDCENHRNLKFLPLFYSRRYEKIGAEKKQDYKYDFSFVGTAHPKKYKFIKMMSEQLRRVYPNQFIYFFFPSKIVYYYRKFKNPELKKASIDEFNFVPVSGNKMDELISDSRCILDSAQDGQRGLTIRVLESLGARRKLITTNADVVNYDFYREENIYVYDGNIDYDSLFFKEPYHDLPEQIYSKYSLKSWLSEMIS